MLNTLLYFVVGQFSTLTKQLNNEKLPPLHSQVLLPQQVSSDRDADLEVSSIYLGDFCILCNGTHMT